MAEKKITMQSTTKATKATEAKVDTISDVPANSTEIENNEAANAVNVANDVENKPTDATEATKGTDETAPKVDKPTNEAQVEEQSFTINKAKYVVEYIAGGIWKDAKGEYWASEGIIGTNIANTRAYTEAEYTKREDLHFMVQYGSMKSTKVTL